MWIDIDAKMIVGVYYDDLPAELKKLSTDDLYNFLEDNELEYASLWYDAEIKSWIIGRTVNNNVPEEDLDAWLIKVKEAFKEVKDILKVNPDLISTQHVCWLILF